MCQCPAPLPPCCDDRNQEELLGIRKYITDNPRNWATDSARPGRAELAPALRHDRRDSPFGVGVVRKERVCVKSYRKKYNNDYYYIEILPLYPFSVQGRDLDLRI